MNSGTAAFKKGVNVNKSKAKPTPPAKPVTTKPKAELSKTRPASPDHLGQAWWRELELLRKAPQRRLGFERLGHMHSVGIPFKFEEFQGRHPFDFVEETKQHFKEPPTAAERTQHPVEIEDWTVPPIREWMEPVRKGQAYWDYCRDKWMNKVSQLGAALAPACSIYTLSTVTDHCLQYGGCAFIIAYLAVTLLFTIPVIYMELVIGQFNRFGVARSMKQCCPLLLGVGYFMLGMCFMDYLFSLSRLSWLLYYMVSSITSEFPWRVCDKYWNTNKCKATHAYNLDGFVYVKGEKTPAVEHFRINVLRQIDNEGELKLTPLEVLFRGPNIGVTVCFLCLLFLFHYMSSMKCRELGRKMYFLFHLAFFLFLTAFAFRGFIVPQPFERVVVSKAFDWFYNTETISTFIVDKNTWIAAYKFAIVSSGIGTGIHVTFGSHNAFVNHEIKYNAVVTGLMGCLVHCTVASFFILCHFSLRETIQFKKSDEGVEPYGNDTLFEIFPQIAAQHQPSRGYGWMMFNCVYAALLMLGLLRVLSCLHTIKQHYCDMNKHYYEPLRTCYNYWEKQRAFRQHRTTLWLLSHRRKGILMAKILFLLAVLHLPAFFPYGEFYLGLVERLWYRYILTLVVGLELFLILFFLGVRMLNSYVRKMTTWQATLWYRFVWKMILPIFPVLYFIHFRAFMDPVEDRIGSDLLIYEYIGLLFCLTLLFLLLLQVLVVWLISPLKKRREKLLLMATPEHDHVDAILGIKPLTRLHWMHHLSVPAGISRGACLQPKNLKFPVVRFHFPFLQKLLWNLFWSKLGFKCFNEGDCCQSPCLGKFDTHRKTKSSLMFPAKALELDRESAYQPPPYIPNEQIHNIVEMRKAPVKNYRKEWVKEKMMLKTVPKKTEPAKAPLLEKEKKGKPIAGGKFSNKPIPSSSSPSAGSSSGSRYTSEWSDSDISMDYEMSPLGESSDQYESHEWEHFSDSSIYSTDSDQEEAENNAGGDNPLKRRTIRKTFGQISFLKGDRSVENLLIKDRDYFPDFTVDELEEFEDIMDDEPHDHAETDVWSESTSETDTDESSDTIPRPSRKEDADARVVISDENISLPRALRRKRRSQGLNDRKAQDKGDDDASFSSCSTSCSSGDESDWSRRSSDAPNLAEARGALISRKKSLMASLSKAKERYAAKKRPLVESKSQERVEEEKFQTHQEFVRKSKLGRSIGDEEGMFTDTHRKLRSFLAINRARGARIKPLNAQQQDEDTDFVEEEEEKEAAIVKKA